MSHDLHNRLQNLKTAKRRISPDPAWVRGTRETLLMQAKNTLPPAANLRWSERIRGTVRAFVPQGTGRWIRRPAMGILSILAVATGGSIMSVSAAEQALPGDLLYGLKLVSEQTRLAFTPVKEEKLKLKTEFTVRRVQELKQVASDSSHPNRVVEVAEMLKRDLDTMKQQLGEVVDGASSDTATRAAKLVDQKTNEVINALQGTKSQLSPESKEKVTEAQSAAADAGVKAIEILVEKNQESNDLISSTDVAQSIKDHAKTVDDATSSTLQPATSTGIMSSSTTLTDIAATSSASTSTEGLSSLVNQVKDATTQAFALQKAREQLEAVASAQPAGTATSTSSVTTTLPLPDIGSVTSTSSMLNGTTSSGTSAGTAASGTSPPP